MTRKTEIRKKTDVERKKSAKSMPESDTDKIHLFKENLRKIIDPHTGINIVDMKMVQNIYSKGEGVSLDFIPTSPFCPVVDYFVEKIKKAAKHAGFVDCEVNLKI
ncbi:MAG: iron-sulfur cluster assembly protein [Candidatus Micrarchaeia archaeon]